MDDAPRAHALIGRGLYTSLEIVPSVDSTNAELGRRGQSGALAVGAVLATGDQTAGRGRLGRQWIAPPGGTLAVSVVLTADCAPAGWIPLAAGLAMYRTVSRILADRPVELKWPNDVLVEGLKISGILAELVPAGVVVLGAGLNLTLAREQLPTATSTSLVLEGAAEDDLFDRALAAYLAELEGVLSLTPAALRDDVARACTTLGREVRVELPEGRLVEGWGVRLEDDGRLVVQDAHGERLTVGAGDVTHLRHR